MTTTVTGGMRNSLRSISELSTVEPAYAILTINKFEQYTFGI